MDEHLLHHDLFEVLDMWTASKPKSAEAKAAVIDFRCLQNLAPQNPKSLAVVNSGPVDRLIHLADYVSYMKGVLRAACLRLQQFVVDDEPIISPYRGGVALQGTEAESLDTKRLRVAVFNPGRTGFLTLCTQEVMMWRLLIITQFLEQEQIDVCFLPGARWPAGASVPDSVAFQWMGNPSSSWASIGALVSKNVLGSVQQVSILDFERSMWLEMKCIDKFGSPNSIFCCGFYAAPGGDTHTWSRVLQELGALQVANPQSDFLLLCDGNVHLSHCVAHDVSCVCPHCKQSSSDRKIEALILAAGLVVLNEDKPTHDSGNMIDLILGTLGNASAHTYAENIGGSDHRLVRIDVSSTVQMRGGESMGRVGWGFDHLWPSMLAPITPILTSFSHAVWEAAAEMGCDESLPVKRRRQIMEAAAWVREALYCFAGHAGRLVQVTLPRKRKRSHKESQGLNEDVKSCLEQEKWNHSHEFATLYSSNPAKAAAYVAAFFKRQKTFKIALKEETTGEYLPAEKAAALVANDLWIRGNAHHDSSEDDGSSRQLRATVAQIRAAGAPIQGLASLPRLPANTTGHQPQLYDLLELEACLKAMKSNKKAVHNPLAAIKAACGPSRQVTLALVNLGRVCKLSPSLWSCRVISPLRKGGPRTVTSMKWLRPVSQASDMSAIQDGLWLTRCKPFLERFSSLSQFGGKYDAIALLVAVMLHVQIRDYQGLMSYVLFADMKQAFDVANKDLMLYMCYLAGITATEWLLLYDFFNQDTAAVQVGGFLTGMMKFAAGIPQGRRFSLHTFTAGMHALKIIMESVCPTSCTFLPPFACEALDGTWWQLSGSSIQNLLNLSPTNIVDSVRLCLQLGWYEQARALACSSLLHLPAFHDRVRCMEALGELALGPLFFVDDIVAIYPDADSVNLMTQGGLQLFTELTKAEFNFGPGKTATMACFEAPPAEFNVESYKLLGVEVTPNFNMDHRLNIICAKGRACFDEFCHLAETSGFSIPLMTFEATKRVLPVVTFGLELLISVPGAEKRLNQLQGYWAKTLVGARSSRDVRANLAIRQCGWTQRLGTLMIERAMLCFTRLQLFPPEHPSRLLLEAALSVPCVSWATDAKCLFSLTEVSLHIPHVHECGLFPADILQLALTDSAVRRNVLKTYRNQILRPLLREYDDFHTEACKFKLLPGLRCKYVELQDDDMLMTKLLPVVIHWRLLRIWLLVRVTGQWPLCLYWPEDNTDVLDACPFCEQKQILVDHAFLECPYMPNPPAGVRTPNCRSLFNEGLEGPLMQMAICHVGRCVHEMLLASKVGPNTRVDQWLNDFGDGL